MRPKAARGCERTVLSLHRPDELHSRGARCGLCRSLGACSLDRVRGRALLRRPRCCVRIGEAPVGPGLSGNGAIDGVEIGPGWRFRVWTPSRSSSFSVTSSGQPLVTYYIHRAAPKTDPHRSRSYAFCTRPDHYRNERGVRVAIQLACARPRRCGCIRTGPLSGASVTAAAASSIAAAVSSATCRPLANAFSAAWMTWSTRL